MEEEEFVVLEVGHGKPAKCVVEGLIASLAQAKARTLLGSGGL